NRLPIIFLGVLELVVVYRHIAKTSKRACVSWHKTRSFGVLLLRFVSIDLPRCVRIRQMLFLLLGNRGLLRKTASCSFTTDAALIDYIFYLRIGWCLKDQSSAAHDVAGQTAATGLLSQSKKR